MRFYLGTDRTNWLWTVHDVPLFISHRVLAQRRTPFPRATTDWALDSGGFTELKLHGSWDRMPPEEYIEAVRRYQRELGRLVWASPQDWMCEPWVLTGGTFAGVHYVGTGLTVEEHQRRTVQNFLDLTRLAPDLPFMPVLQGWDMDDYHRCVDMYADAGVDLWAYPVVGVGSVCRRQGEAGIAMILDSLAARGLRLHGFGVKTQGLGMASASLASADSMAWSFRARMGRIKLPGCTHRGVCSHCHRFAVLWHQEVIESLAGWRQDSLFSGAS